MSSSTMLNIGCRWGWGYCSDTPKNKYNLECIEKYLAFMYVTLLHIIAMMRSSKQQ